MRRRNLPLGALRSFEAAGRHLSFTRAAEELLVSQAAVSKQVRELEFFLGSLLFRRSHRRITLTETGSQLLLRMTHNFDGIERAVSDIVEASKDTKVHVSVEPAFATAWLVPHLGDFHTRHPDVDVVIDLNPRLAELDGAGATLAVRYSAEADSWPNIESVKLVSLSHTPMLSPVLLARGTVLETPSDLRQHPLLHVGRTAWKDWFANAGVPLASSDTEGLILSDMALSLQAATRAYGVAMGSIFLAEADLAAGTLVMPFDTAIQRGSYFLCAGDFRQLTKGENAFVNWIKASMNNIVFQAAKPPEFEAN